MEREGGKGKGAQLFPRRACGLKGGLAKPPRCCPRTKSAAAAGPHETGVSYVQRSMPALIQVGDPTCLREPGQGAPRRAPPPAPKGTGHWALGPTPESVLSKNIRAHTPATVPRSYRLVVFAPRRLLSKELGQLVGLPTYINTTTKTQGKQQKQVCRQDRRPKIHLRSQWTCRIKKVQIQASNFRD